MGNRMLGYFFGKYPILRQEWQRTTRVEMAGNFSGEEATPWGSGDEGQHTKPIFLVVAQFHSTGYSHIFQTDVPRLNFVISC